jgi:hypothetical protein
LQHTLRTARYPEGCVFIDVVGERHESEMVADKKGAAVPKRFLSEVRVREGHCIGKGAARVSPIQVSNL